MNSHCPCFTNNCSDWPVLEKIVNSSTKIERQKKCPLLLKCKQTPQIIKKNIQKCALIHAIVI